MGEVAVLARYFMRTERLHHVSGDITPCKVTPVVQSGAVYTGSYPRNVGLSTTIQRQAPFLSTVVVSRPKTFPLPSGCAERKHGLSTEQFPVSACVGSLKNLKDLKIWQDDSTL